MINFNQQQTNYMIRFNHIIKQI